MGLLNWLRARFPTAREEMLRWMRDDYGRRFEEDCAAQRAKERPAVCAMAESVAQKIRRRADFGFEKYGVTLADSPESTEAILNHAQEEAMDLAVYLETIMQRRAQDLLAASAIQTVDLTKVENTIQTMDLTKTPSTIKVEDLSKGISFEELLENPAWSTSAKEQPIDLDAAKRGSDAAAKIAGANDQLVDVICAMLIELGLTSMRLTAENLKASASQIVSIRHDPETGGLKVTRS